MEAREPAIKSGGELPVPRDWAALIFAVSLTTAALWAWSGRYGVLLVGGMAGAAAVTAAFRYPIALVAGLLILAPFNYGWVALGGVVKASEGIVILMLAVLMLRLAARDVEAWARVRRGGVILALLFALGVVAVATAWPHPHNLNVRYEVENYIALAYAMIFFRRRHWPLLTGVFIWMMFVESMTALVLKYGMGLTGLSFFSERGGIQYIRLTAEDLEGLAGGLFRISGTFGHKNLLAAFYVLLLPMATIALMRRMSLAGALVLAPAYVALALTDSMTAWGAMLVTVVVSLIYLRRFDYLAIAFLVLLPFAALALGIFGGSIFYRISQLMTGAEGYGTVSSRITMLKISQRLVAEYPWFGIGRNNFTEYGQTFYAHAHNLFIMKTIETGIPGGLMFLAFIFAALGRTWKVLTLHAAQLAAQGQYYRYLGVWLGCLGFTAMNMFDYNYANFSLGPMFMMLLGVLLAAGSEAALVHSSRRRELPQ